MIRRWMGMALLGGCLLGSGVARAQYLPAPVGPARMPEPIPEATAAPPPPNLVPGPMTPGQAPTGPPDALSLPSNHSGAFQLENYVQENSFLLNIGSTAFQRQQLGKGAEAVTDSGSGVFTGSLSKATTNPALQYNDVSTPMSFGVSGSIGYLVGGDTIELAGFYLPTQDTSSQFGKKGGIDSYFFDAPPGFQPGARNIFLQASRATNTLETEMGDAEINYRYTNVGINDLELIIGVRYLDSKESLGIFTGDGPALASQSATYTALTHNRILAPQFGFEYEHNALSWLSFGATAKGAWGANFLDIQHTLERSDGVSGFVEGRTSTEFSQLYQIGAFLDIQLFERAKLRAGYNAMWLLQIASVVDQIDFNLQNPGGNRNTNGSIFYHGPMIEVQFLF